MISRGTPARALASLALLAALVACTDDGSGVRDEPPEPPPPSTSTAPVARDY